VAKPSPTASYGWRVTNVPLRIRRLRGGRFLFFGLGHGRIWILLLVLVVIVAITLLNNRRR